MTTTERRRTLAELASLGESLFAVEIQPHLLPEQQGQFVVIDVESGDFEIDPDHYSAIVRLQARKPDADIWTMRAGYPTTCRIGGRR